jgi:cytoskeletal protein CcmA (bactofilin family)
MKRTGWRKLIGVVALAVMLALLIAPAALAMDPREGDNVVIGASEVINDDLYVGATNFTLDGVVKGDVVAVGETVTINGTVEGSLLAAGRSIIINGTVKNTARVAGAAITLGEKARIGGDVLAAGYSLETKAGSTVARDLAFAGSQALAAGDVTRRGWVAGNGFELRGKFGGDLRVYMSDAQDMGPVSPSTYIPNLPAVPTVPNALHLAPGAKVGGNLDYTAIADIPTPEGVAGKVTRHAPPVRDQKQVSFDPERAAPASAGMAVLFWLWDRTRRLIALFLVGLLMAFVFPLWTRRLMDTVQQKPLPSLGWGFVAMIAAFAGFIVIFLVTLLLALLFGAITLGGLVGTIIGLGLLATVALGVVFGLAVTYVAPIVISYLLGRLIFSWAKLSPVLETLLALFVGLLVYVLVTAIPCFGWLIGFVAVLMGLGALWMWARGLIEKQTPAA